ncbi:GH25 family lysozyme [Arthrobacter psychrochitiniphilus]|uniref:lysozyme n=1 Tax=Arthrobacter psychrochitiniphilus TaxID=291045 RepID=A0A2V3DRL0_9MICC|nr:GH25 family lysozyme [Arthrobacter psychrochitiniphilus]NYG18325.1 GH25 family lysozyme M1 (1,4-beta-N-acetylmuramidase) [Arthrobacter psychrochitiniphilus]PXA64896.1 lysozyme M1 [Arthrobacter psychrochitiniphilus]
MDENMLIRKKRTKSPGTKPAMQLAKGLIISLALISGSIVPAIAGPTEPPVTANTAANLNHATALTSAEQSLDSAAVPSAEPALKTSAASSAEPVEKTQLDDVEISAYMKAAKDEVTPTFQASIEEQRGVAGARMGQGLAYGDSSSQPGQGTIKSGVAAPFAATSWIPAGVLGVDVSGHQPNVDWAQQSRLGAKFAYVKATEGIDFKSQKFSSQYSGAYSAGLIRGAYHFALPNESSGAVQAEFFVKNGGGWSSDGMTLPPLLDIEYNPYSSYGNSCFNMSASQMVTWIKDFSNRILALTKRLPMIYTTSDWWRTCTGNSAAFPNHPLHIAAYPLDLANGFKLGPGGLPASWSNYDFWQFSDSWNLAGDSNVWRGTYAELQAFAAKSDVSVTPPVANDFLPQSLGIGDYNFDGANDLLQSREDGTLWFYPGKGNGTFGTAIRIGTGFGVYTKLTALGDFNRDGRPDFAGLRKDGSWWFYAGTGVVNSANTGYKPAVRTTATLTGFTYVTGIGDLTGDGLADVAAIKADGTLWILPGTGVVSAKSSGLGAAKKIGNSGWNAYSSIVRVGDVDENGTDDFAAVGKDGTLWLYPGSGKVSTTSSGYLARVRWGKSGWNKFAAVIGAGDLNGDRQPDLIGRNKDSSYSFYAGTLAGNDGYRPARIIGNSGWDKFKQVISVGDFNGDKNPDLLGVRTDGQLYFYGGDGVGGYRPAMVIGYGWNIYSGIYGVGDYNKDGSGDLLAVRPDGTLWFYAGTGRIGGSDQGYARALQVGRAGWNAFTQVIGPGDISGDKLVDLVGIKADGSVWLYAGNGKVSSNSEGYSPGVRANPETLRDAHTVASAFDFNADGSNDLLATKNDGSLWFYPGSGRLSVKGTFNTARLIGKSGWNAYSSVVGVGDSNNDGLPDMIGVNKNGTLWYYSGTSMRADGISPGVQNGYIR